MAHRTILKAIKTIALLVTKCDERSSESVGILNDLPAEILDRIASFLPASAAACLSLSSRTIFVKLGSVYIEKINKADLSVVRDPMIEFENLPIPTLLGQERETFLDLISQDIKNMIYCYNCKMIHHYEKIQDEISRPKVQRYCSNVEDFPRSQHYFHDNLYFSRVQYIMKQHRYGIDTSSYLKDLRKTCTLYGQDYTRQISTEARIVGQNLLLRSQHWFLGGKSGLDLPDYFELDLCPHLNTRGVAWVGDWHSHRALDLIANCEYHGRGDSCKFCPGLRNCDTCATEFQADRVKLSLVNGKSVLVFTIWQDLGECIIPFDAKWQHHIRYRSGWGPSPVFELGSIKESFERGSNYIPKLSWSARRSLCASVHENWWTTIKTPCI